MSKEFAQASIDSTIKRILADLRRASTSTKEVDENKQKEDIEQILQAVLREAGVEE